MSKVTLKGKGFVAESSGISERIDRVMNWGALQIQAQAHIEIVNNAFDTGNLANSLQMAKLGAASYEIYTNVEYAGYVHEGTHKMAARPFFIWALDTVQPRIVQALKGV